MKKILVTGGRGFIGGHVVELLSLTGYEVYSIGRSELGELDLKGVEIVVHLGWGSVPHSSTLDPATDVSENVLSSVRLFQDCINRRIKRIVFMSSGGTVYGKPETTPISESHPIRPISSYGITKATVESYLHFFAINHGIEYVILRGANAYGPGENFSDGQGVIGNWIYNAIRNRPISLVGNGEQTRDFVHVTDLAKAILFAIETDHNNSIFNIGSGKGSTLSALVKKIETVSGKNLEVIRSKARSFDVLENVLDCTKAKKVLGWKAEVDIEDGIRKTWEWMKNQDNKDR